MVPGYIWPSRIQAPVRLKETTINLTCEKRENGPLASTVATFSLINWLKKRRGKPFFIKLKQIPRIIKIKIKLIKHLPSLQIKKMLRTKLTLYLKSRVVMEPRFGSHDDGLTIYVQRSAPLIDDVILTVTSQFDNRLGRTKKKKSWLMMFKNTV